MLLGALVTSRVLYTIPLLLNMTPHTAGWNKRVFRLNAAYSQLFDLATYCVCVTNAFPNAILGYLESPENTTINLVVYDVYRWFIRTN